MNSRLARSLTRELSRTLASTQMNLNRQLTTFRPTMLLKEKITVQVPTMGDSITEGTIVEWAVGIGEAVKEGDVVVLVETDKVTIDIKADFDGVVTSHFGAIDDTVEVGADLYQIDTEAAASDTAAQVNDNVEAATVTENIEPTAVASSSDESSDHGRVPSIQFLGKEGWKQKLSIVGDSSPQAVPEMKPSGSVTVDSGVIPPTYGRLPFSEREMEALIMGGASEAPLYDEA